MREGGILHGRHAVEEAINAGKQLQKVYIIKGGKSQFRSLISRLNELGIPIQEVPGHRFRRLKLPDKTNIAGEVSPVSYHRCEDLIPHLFDQGLSPRIAVLDRITDVRNFGAIARSAHCFGFHGLVIPFTESAQVTPDAIHTSAGALHHIPVCREANIGAVVNSLKLYGIQVVACSEHGNLPISKADFNLPTAIVFGSEDSGISPEVLKLCDQHVHIPITGEVGSLNVSVAAAVAFYESTKVNENRE